LIVFYQQQRQGEIMNNIRLFVAKQALEVYIKYDGEMQLTRNGAQNAVLIVSEMTGKTYKRSMAGKHEALADCLVLLGEGGE
jgi:hypothetical protein